MSSKLYAGVVASLSLLFAPESWAAIKEYHLNINQGMVNVTGKPVKRMTVNGKFIAPLLEFEEGDEAVIHVHNQLKDQDTSLHWHGLLLPGLMDGVPGFNGFQGIKPQGDFTYRFKVRQNGTYWYHAHSKGQEQDGLYGPLVIYPKGKQPVAAHEKAERDYVVMLSDFHESDSVQIMANLKKSAEYYQNQRETVGDVWKQVKQQGLKASWQDRTMWNQMRMLKTDLSDVTGYTFLVNGQTPQQNWTGAFKTGEKVRLRFINASAMSFFDVRIPDLKMTVVSADGQPVQPVPVDEFRIGAAETYDVMVEPTQAHYQIQAESIDRAGFALASLQNEMSLKQQKVEMPKARSRALLTMEDMGHGQMDMGKMDHGSHQQMNMEHHSHDQMQMSASAMSEHSQHQTMASSDKDQPDTVQGWANASTPTGHKALQYADLKSLTPQADTRPAERELVIRLGGTMERYIWTIDGKKFSDKGFAPLKVKYGERIRLKFVNDSMMAHPMHLHGMFMQLENGQSAQDMPNKHTIIVPPGKTVTAMLTADELGEWAIHCHLLYHMSAGMMSKLIVANVDDTKTPMQMPVQSSQGESHVHH
ncbi:MULTISPECIES: copper resistance system multicopper oxidase [unclassified Acinetobacter]|uniref:copper resistance system multicopper oxidase n=1 Tax=unclassified Acinetobacter TaxID=196816 RepID=UPI00244735F9|nr:MULTISPECIES: copper resistance system multicopper oxidase [unclassified Acinetobacter]MDH0030886.1 copper resistance system multicopper oxidase [Acinetobacter sp. GD04021]MDH0886341.1 copper resistance system multicopper oxidase [Acinetobacter sp. GD03873]MDH1082909.1 copper resistance system multicopper oxidase [Acinetobacter sp. GD03983]MDH2189935.1 copper resistance system multicopper oxidase [Acinetobacter sp. GD03645]MDH2203088.1 copper resistance system multicopper oxidase [Acinetoba